MARGTLPLSPCSRRIAERSLAARPHSLAIPWRSLIPSDISEFPQKADFPFRFIIIKCCLAAWGIAVFSGAGTEPKYGFLQSANNWWPDVDLDFGTISHRSQIVRIVPLEDRRFANGADPHSPSVRSAGIRKSARGHSDPRRGLGPDNDDPDADRPGKPRPCHRLVEF